MGAVSSAAPALLAFAVAVAMAEKQSVRPAQKMTGREHWTKDEDVTSCRQCSAPFNLFRWRHHCRVCGHIFCHDCSNNYMGIHRPYYDEGLEKQKRVCMDCYKGCRDEKHN